MGDDERTELEKEVDEQEERADEARERAEEAARREGAEPDEGVLEQPDEQREVRPPA